NTVAPQAGSQLSYPSLPCAAAVMRAGKRAGRGAAAPAVSPGTAGCATTAMTQRLGPLALCQPRRRYFRGGPSWAGGEARYCATFPYCGYGLRTGLLRWSPGGWPDLRSGRRAGDRVRAHAQRGLAHQGLLREPADLAGL